MQQHVSNQFEANGSVVLSGPSQMRISSDAGASMEFGEVGDTNVAVQYHV